MRLFVRDWKNHAEHDVIAAGGEAHDLPRADDFLRQLIDRNILDHDPKKPLVQAVRQNEFLAAPRRGKPIL